MGTLTFDLHALFDEARRRGRRRRWAYAAALAVLAVGIGGGVALRGGSPAVPAPPAPPGYHLVKARGDVQHALLAFSYRGAENGYPLGRLGKGERVEVWVDPTSGFVRTRGPKLGGRGVSDETSRCFRDCAVSVPLLGRYWPVDTTKFVRRPGLGTFHGRPVIWLGVLENTFAPASRNGEWIALDPRTHDAVGDRRYGTTDKVAGQVLFETRLVKRFPDIAANRFWFALKDRRDVQSVEFAPVPLDLPGRVPPDLRRAVGVVVGRLGQATVFAGRRRDGSWWIFRVGKDGTVGGGGWRRSGPNTLRVGIDWGGHNQPFNGRAYLVVAGGMLAAPSTKLYLTSAGIRRRLRLSPAAAHSQFGSFVFPRALKIRRGRAITLEVVRGSRVIARLPFSPPFYPQTKSFVPPYYQPMTKQPGPLALAGALRVLGLAGTG